MKRVQWITLVALFVLGASFNVLVAAGCALWSPIDWRRPPSHSGLMNPTYSWQADLLPGSQLATDEMLAIATLERGWGAELRTAATRDRSAIRSSAAQFLSGWPLKALSCQTRSQLHLQRTDGWYGGVAGPEPLRPMTLRSSSFVNAPREPRPIPYRPIPLGFTLNTLFYTAILGALLLTFRSFRANLRKSRGRCAKCAYALAGLATDLSPPAPGTIIAIVCPECGTPSLPKASRGVSPRRKHNDPPSPSTNPEIPTSTPPPTDQGEAHP